MSVEQSPKELVQALRQSRFHKAPHYPERLEFVQNKKKYYIAQEVDYSFIQIYDEDGEIYDEATPWYHGKLEWCTKKNEPSIDHFQKYPLFRLKKGRDKKYYAVKEVGKKGFEHPHLCSLHYLDVVDSSYLDALERSCIL